MKFDQFLVIVAVSLVIIGILAIAPTAQAKTPTLTITPTDLTATAVSPTQITLSWNAPTQNYGKTIIGYKIEQRLSTGAFYTILEDTGSTFTTHSLTGLTTGTTYAYRVSAVYSDYATTDPSNPASATPTPTSVPPPTQPPSSPITNVKFDFTPSDGTTLTAVTITQNDYQILQYKKDPRSIISNALPTTEALTNDLNGVIAYQNNHLSPSTIPGPLIAKAVSSTQITLSWLPPIENYLQNIVGYKIEWKRAPSDYVIIDDNTHNDTKKYSIVGLTTGTYTYRVSAIYSDHTTSNPSNEASGIILPSQPTQPTTPSPIIPTTTPPTPTTQTPPVTNVKFDFTSSDGTTLTAVILTQSDYQQLIVIKDPRSLISNITQTTGTINNNLSGLLRYQTIHSKETIPPQQTPNYTQLAPNNTTSLDNKLVDGVITAVVASGAISIITWFVRTKIAKKITKEYYFTMEKFLEDSILHIRIRNSGQTIEDCIILCDGVACVWTDTKIDKPRHAYEGSISVVRLPDDFENNPLISVKSGKKVLKKIHLDDMAHG